MSTSAPLHGVAWPSDLQRELERDLLIQTAIASILRISLEPIDLREQMHRILDLIIKLEWLHLEHMGCIFLVEDDPRKLVMKAQIDMPEGALESCSRVDFGMCICGRAIAQKKIMFKECVDDHHCITYPGIAPHGHYCVPLMSGKRHTGLLNLYVKEHHEPSPIEGQFLRAVADVLAGVIERRRVEESLRVSEERFDLAVRGIDAGVWDWDLRTNTVFYSSHWKGLLGYEGDEIGDQFSEWEDRLHPEERDRALAALNDYLEGRVADYEQEYRLRHKDGSYRWCLARGAMTTDQAGRPSRMVGSNLDITERKRVEQELRQRVASLSAAKKILEHLLPRDPLGLPGLVINGACFAADYAQGDFFDYFTLEDGSVVAAVADVSGHGIDAALLMTSVQSRLRSFAEILPGVDQVLKRMNEALIRQTDGEHFVSLIALRIDPRTRVVSYSNAGHPPGYIFNRVGEIKSCLDSTSTPLGIEADEQFPIGGPIALETGDLILLFTDGIFEARCAEGVLFGIDNVLRVVRDRIELPNEQILASLRAAVREFTRSEVLSDDVTIVLIRVT